MLRNKQLNFFTTQELTKVWHAFNTNPRWQYRRMSGGKWFWWYMFLQNNQFIANNEQQWKNCTDIIWRQLYDKVCSYAGNNFVPYRYLINGQTMEQQGHPHSDFAKTKDNHATFLAYLNLEWEPEWGGETVFYWNKSAYTNENIRETVMPEPGLIIEYDSRIVHKGTPPLVPDVLRVTLAIQGEYA